jgi:tyrosine-protein phosphatase SIW14
MPPGWKRCSSLALFVAMLSLAGVALTQTEQQPTSEPEYPAGQHTVGQHLKAEGVPNFGEVTPTLYRGGQPTAVGFETLAHMGIAIIVDTGRSKRDEALIKKLGMTYISLPWYCPLPKDKVFAQFIQIIRKNSGKKIFVHCRLGDDRTGMMIAAYRMAADGWTAKEAMHEMHSFGYTTFHHLICPGLGRYETHFPEHLKKDPAFEDLR